MSTYATDPAHASDADRYGPVVAGLLRPGRLMPLGPGRPDPAVRGRLEALTPESIFAPQAVRDRDMAAACLAGLWLYHDFLDESHTISQGIETPAGSYWHGLMHRREPDAANARYWFRQVGPHPVFVPLAAAAAEIARRHDGPAAQFLAAQTVWDPFAFIDLSEEARTGRSPAEALCREVQQREWELLFEHCHRAALGAG